MRAERFLATLLVTACSSSSPTTSDAGADVTYYQGGDGDVYAYNDAAGVCQPSQTTAFTPVKIAPLVNHVCTDAQIASYVAQCLDPSLPDRTACDAWKAIPENEACITTCPVASNIAATPVTGDPPPTPQGPWGPFIKFTNPGTFELVDFGACVALADPSSAGQACADALNTQLECEYFACAGNCAIPTADGGADAAAILNAEEAYQNCTYAADSSQCASFVAASIACVPTLAASASFCVDGTLYSGDPSTYDPAIEKLLGAQCGGAISDAGTDAAITDASGD